MQLTSRLSTNIDLLGMFDNSLRQMTRREMSMESHRRTFTNESHIIRQGIRSSSVYLKAKLKVSNESFYTQLHRIFQLGAVVIFLMISFFLTFGCHSKREMF